MDVVLAILAIILLLLGLFWSFAPILPWPPVSLIGLVVLELTRYADFGTQFWIVMVLLTAVTIILDYVIPVVGTKKFGGSKIGTRGATIWLIVWLFGWPLGIVIGPFLGAMIGELIIQRSLAEAFHSGLGSLVGFIVSTWLKFVVSWLMLRYGIAAILS